MTKTRILLTLLFVLVKTIGTVTLFWLALAPLTGHFPMSAQAKAMMVVLNIAISLLLFLLSLPALLLSKPSVRFSSGERFWAFMGMPLFSLAFTILLFILDNTERTETTDFFILGLPSIVHTVWMYYHYRKISRRINQEQAPTHTS